MDLKLENRVVEISYSAEEKTMNEMTLSRDFWDNAKLIFICILDPHRTEKEAKNIIEDIILKILSILEKTNKTQNQSKGRNHKIKLRNKWSRLLKIQ